MMTVAKPLRDLFLQVSLADSTLRQHRSRATQRAPASYAATWDARVERIPHDAAPLFDLHSSAVGDMPSRGVLALRTAIQGVMRNGSPDDDVLRAMRVFCAEARRREVNVERVLVLIKQTWRTLPEVRRLGGARREAALAHLTTLAIRTFYDSASPPAPPPAPASRNEARLPR